MLRINRLFLLAAALMLAFGSVSGGVPEVALQLPEAVDQAPLLKRELELALAGLGNAATERESALRLAHLYHANGYEVRAKALYAWLVETSEGGEEAARLLYLLADASKEKGELEASLRHLEAAVALYGDYPSLHERLGEARFKSGDLEGAESSYRAALVLDARLAPAWLGLARVLAQKGDEDGAVATLDRLLEIDRDNYNGRALLARLRERRGEEEQARALRLGMTQSSAAPLFDAWLSPVLEAVYDPQKLDFLFLDFFLVGELERALPLLERLEEADPDNPRVYRYRGVYWQKMDKMEQAIASFRQGITLGGEADVFYPLLVQSLRQLDRLDEAESEARSGLAGTSGLPLLRRELAKLLFDRGRPDEALPLLEESLLANPYDVETLLLHARAALWSSDPARAESSFDLVYQYALGDAETLTRAALVRMESRQYEKALLFLDQALRLSPSHPEAIELLVDANVALGQQARRRGEREQAMGRFEQVLAINPMHRDALSGRAQLLLELRRYGEAEGDLRTLLGVVGDDPRLLTAYGDALFQNGKVAEGRGTWEKALRILPVDTSTAGLRQALEQRLQRR